MFGCSLRPILPGWIVACTLYVLCLVWVLIATCYQAADVSSTRPPKPSVWMLLTAARALIPVIIQFSRTRLQSNSLLCILAGWMAGWRHPCTIIFVILCCGLGDFTFSLAKQKKYRKSGKLYYSICIHSLIINFKLKTNLIINFTVLLCHKLS